MASPSKPYLLSFSVFLFILISLTEATKDGFTVELIHRDSPSSPLSNSVPALTRFQKVNEALRRSIKRANHFYPEAKADAADESEAQIFSINGEYVLAYSLGTPPFQFFGIADTGSDLVWLQCKPCDQCFSQTAPFFDPSKSRTYRNPSCFSKQCQSAKPSVGQISCDDDNTCQYDIRYGDNSVSSGEIATDTLTLGSTRGRRVAFPNTVFGCGHHNGGTFAPQTSGIVGLGRGSVSLVSQMGSSVEGKFSYCLLPFFSNKNSSTLNFGQNAVVSGRGTVSTPMVSKNADSFYYLTLEGMSVGAKRLEFTAGDSISDKKAMQEGNIIIDSGTTLTLLTEEFYTKLESEVAAQIKLKRASDPGRLLNLCYRSLSETIEAPVITAHFKGADVKLNPLNTFVKVSDDVACFAFQATPNGAIFGNLAQMNFLVGYDLQKKLVSFKPADCTKV